MRQGNLQILQRPIAERRPVRTVSARPMHPDDEDDSLILTVLHRRWKLLALSTLVSIAIGAYAYSTNKIPTSVTTGQLIYKPLPPSESTNNMKLSSLTISELIKSNECIMALRKKHNMHQPIKRLRELIDVKAARFSEIIDIEFTWNNGQQGIDIVNDVMQIASEIVSNHRKETLKNWRTHKEIEIAELDVKIEEERQNINRLTESLHNVMSQNGNHASNQQALVIQIRDLDNDLRNALRQSNKIKVQIKTLESDAKRIDSQLRQESVTAKQNLLAARKKILASPTPKMIRLEQTLESFIAENSDLTYTIFKAKLDQACGELLPNVPLQSLAIMERQYQEKLAQIERLRFDSITLPDQINETLHSFGRGQSGTCHVGR